MIRKWLKLSNCHNEQCDRTLIAIDQIATIVQSADGYQDSVIMSSGIEYFISREELDYIIAGDFPNGYPVAEIRAKEAAEDKS